MRKSAAFFLTVLMLLVVVAASGRADYLIRTCTLSHTGEECMFDVGDCAQIKVVFENNPSECMNIDLDWEQADDDWARTCHWNYNSGGYVNFAPNPAGTGWHRIVSASNSPFSCEIWCIEDSVIVPTPCDTYDFPGYTLGSRNCDAEEFGELFGPITVVTINDLLELETVPRFLGGIWPDTVLVGCPFDGWGDIGFEDNIRVTFNHCRFIDYLWDTVFVDISATGVTDPGPHRIYIYPEHEFNCHGYYAELGAVVAPGLITVTLAVTGGAFELDGIWISTAPPSVLAVELASFGATGYEDHIAIEWVTATELGNAGFNLYRSTDMEGEKSKLNADLIPAKGSELEGATYTFKDYDIADGDAYYYWFEDVGLGGESSIHGPVLASPRKDEAPSVFGLAQNYPNPFNPTTEIRFNLPGDCFVTLEVYNVAGQRVATLVNEHMTAGTKIAHWNAKDSNGVQVTSGVYFYRLQAGDFVEIKKMVLMR